MSLEILKLDPSDKAQHAAWQKYVDGAPQATLHHGMGWLEAVEATFPHRPHHLMAMRGTDVVGILPVFEVRSWLAGRILVSVPYAIYGGVVADQPEAADALLERLRQLVHDTRAKYVDIRSAEARWPALASVDRYVTFVKTLPSRVDDVLTTFPRKARAEVRRARDQFKLTVRFDDRQLPRLWELYARSMHRLGSLNVPLRFLQELVGRTPNAHLVSLIYHGHRPVAGLLSFVHRDWILPYYSGSDHPAAAETGANNFLYASLMEKAVEMGLRKFDFGRTRIDNTGSYNFKKNQGFEPTRLGYQFYLPCGGRVPNLTPSNAKFMLAQRLWRHLPLPLARFLGARLSASIPG